MTVRGRLDGHASKLCCDMYVPLNDNDDDDDLMVLALKGLC